MSSPRTTPPVPGIGELRQVDPILIHPSKTNGHRIPSKEAMDGLVESIRAHGIRQPLIARPAPESPQDYELVCGHRRLEAALRLKLESVPVLVSDLSDANAAQLQLVENLQREDLAPMAEARAIEHLLTLVPIEEATTRLGKPASYLATRARLTNLPREAQLALDAGTLSLSVAIMIARIPDQALREQLAEEVHEGRQVWNGSEFVFVPLTVAEARKAFEKTMLRLKNATFSLEDCYLLEDIPNCLACPHRTGNATDLFGDVAEEDVCTNPPCFARKRDAAWQARRVEAEARGYKGLADGRAKKILFDDGKVRIESGFVAPGAPVGRDGDSRTWLQVAKAAKVKPQTFVVRHPQSDKPVQLWRTDDLLELLPKGEEARKALPAARATGGSGDSTPHESKPIGPDEWEIEEEAREQIEVEVARVSGELPPLVFIRQLLAAMMDGWKGLPVYLRLLGLPTKKRAKDLTGPQCQQIIALCVVRDLDVHAAEALGVKVKPLLAAARSRLVAKLSAKDGGPAKAKATEAGGATEPLGCPPESVKKAQKKPPARSGKAKARTKVRSPRKASRTRRKGQGRR